jgi:haloalkane dehalogenase
MVHERDAEQQRAAPSRDLAPWQRLYPFQSNFLMLDGLRYHYLDEGQGAPLLMLHGNPTWSFYWRHLVMRLRNRYRTIVPDHMGCGLSDKPQQYPYHLETHTQNVVTLIQRLGLREITLLAHDWGGAIGLGAALADPERFSRLVLFNSGAFPPPFVPWRIRLCRFPILGTVAVRGMNLFARAALRMATAHPERMSAEVAAGLLAPYDSWQNRVAIDRFVRDIPLTRHHPTWRRLAALEAGLASLGNRPVMLIWGMRDWCFRPSCLDRFRQHWPHAEVHPLDDAGHYVIEDAHERIVPLLERFLAGKEDPVRP